MAKKDRETLKTLNRRQKIRFVLDYYKGYFFLLFITCLIAFYIGDMVNQSRQTIDLQGFFVNDEHNRFPAKQLIKDFSNYMGVKPGHRIAFEDSLFVNLESGSEYHAASQSKIVAYIAAKELDFLVLPEDLAGYYTQSFLLCDLRDIIPDDMITGLEDDLFYARDGSGEEKACGLNLRRSRFFTDGKYEEAYYLVALSYTSHREALASFLRYAYER